MFLIILNGQIELVFATLPFAVSFQLSLHIAMGPADLLYGEGWDGDSWEVQFGRGGQEEQR